MTRNRDKENGRRGALSGQHSEDASPGLDVTRSDPTSIADNLSDGKVTNDDTISKRSVAATFADPASAQDAVTALIDQGFDASQVEQSPVDEGVLVLVHAGPRAIDAVAVLQRAGGDIGSNPAKAPPAK